MSAPSSGGDRFGGMGRSATYEALGQGHLRAIKLGTWTLIDVEQPGLRQCRRRRSPPADGAATKPIRLRG